MSASILNAAENAEERIANQEKHVETWLDDDFFDNLVDVINENFALEVEASLELRS